MQKTISVLDHGYVRLVDSMGNDLSIVRAARVSYNAEWRAGSDTGSDRKLLNYLLTNNHTSPFESVMFTFEIKCPIFIARQWHRHRTWSYNEVSARYTELPEEFYVPAPAVIGTQSTKNKQQRIISQDLNYDEFNAAASMSVLIAEQCASSFATYKQLIADGCPRELARAVLPTSTYTKFFGTVSLHNLLKFLSLRDHSHAQHEAQEYAKALKELIKQVVPITSDLLWGSGEA